MQVKCGGERSFSGGLECGWSRSRVGSLAGTLVGTLLWLVTANDAAVGAMLSAQVEEELPWAAPPLERSISVRDTHSEEEISFAELLDRLQDVDAVFLGETHIDECTHRVESAVYEGLLELREGKVVLAMEMFERDVQPVLDEYLEGRCDEQSFLARSRPWNNYSTAYRPLIERARTDRRKVVASNFPRPLRTRMMMEGPEVLKSLQGEERRWAPAELLPNTAAYWRRTDNAIRGHLAMMRSMEAGDEQRLNSTQTLWDNSMGESAALALEENPGCSVLHVNGGFHTQYADGTARQFHLRRPQASIATVAITPVVNPSVAELWGVPEADYVVFVESRARDFNDGSWSVEVSISNDYLLHVPKGASFDSPVPLLIWLCDDGLQAQDGMDLWKDRLGDHAAIAVLQPLHREQSADLGIGGRWFFSDRFSEDVSSARTALERMWAFVLRHSPVDPSRVCLVGEGSGATVAVAATLFSTSMDVTTLAIGPSQYAKLKDFPLPLPEESGDEPVRRKSLRVSASESDRDWWEQELGEYREVGLDAVWQPLGADPWSHEVRLENALREALGLEREPENSQAPRQHLLWDGDSPRAFQWLRLRALRSSASGSTRVAVLTEGMEATGSEGISTQLDPGQLKAPGAIPLCPGPFGGSTVLVLPAGTNDLERWIALESDDPLQKHSRFHRLRIATQDIGERDLVHVLRQLESENRSNVLVVPAIFCADATQMRALERSTRGLADTMTLQWQPGLGAAPPSAPKENGL